MKRFLCALLLTATPLADAVADGAKTTNARVTLVYQHELPNVPGKSIKGVLVEYGPGGRSEAIRIRHRRLSTPPYSRGRLPVR